MGLDEIAYLRELVEERSIRCYGRRLSERVVGAWAQVDHELGLIEQLGFAGYFLVCLGHSLILPDPRYLLPRQRFCCEFSCLLRLKNHQC